MKAHVSFRIARGLALLIVLAVGALAATPTGKTLASKTALDWQIVISNLPTHIWQSTLPENNPTLYVTTGQDLRRSTDNGETWQALYPPAPLPPTDGISAMTFDPAATVMPTLFVARNPSGSPADIYRSTDDGLTWGTVFTTTASVVQDLAAARAGDGSLAVFAVGGAHVWRSKDGGTSWSEAESGLPAGSDLYRVYASPAYASDTTLYLVAFGDLLRSTNGGDSWARVAIPWVDSPRHVVFSPDYATDGTLWISYFWIEGHGEYPPNGIVRSIDFGATWEMVNQGLPVNYLDGWIMGLGVSPDYPIAPTLFAVERIMDSTWQLYRSTDGGDHWELQGATPPVFPTGALLATPDLLYLSSQSGLYRLDLPSEYYAYLPLISANLKINNPPSGKLMIDGQAAYRLIGHPASQVIYALTSAGLYRSDDGAHIWSLMNPSPPTTDSLVLAPGQPEILFAGAGYPCYQGGPDVAMFKSTDSGQTWEELPAGVNLQPLAVNPTDPEHVYARGCDGPWLSTNGGGYCNRQGDPLFSVYDVHFIAPAASDDWQTVYLGCITEGGSGAIIASQRFGTDWLQVTPADSPPWYIQSLAVDPLDARKVYFGEPNAFWGSQDSGATWTRSTAGLEEVIYDPTGPITQTYGLLSLALQPTDLDQIFLGSVRGLYHSDDRGETWSKVFGPTWLDSPINELLLRWSEPDKLFVTTPDGVYVFYP